jgi:chitin disaccharide deacetylase
MMPGGHDTYIRADRKQDLISRLKREGKYRPGMTLPEDPVLVQVRALGEKLWRAGLPVLDDLHNTSYEWEIPPDVVNNDARVRKWRTQRYIETLKELKPGLTMVIMHCTAPTEIFSQITDSGPLRKADMMAMLDPDFQVFLKQQEFTVTTWREAHERRKRSQ